MADTTPKDDELRQKLAVIEHHRWSDWQSYLHSLCIKNEDGSLTIRVDSVKHWERQMKLTYRELTYKEQLSDMEQVDRYWSLIKQYGIQERIDERNKGHWYAGGYGKDANGFEIGYKCNCGFVAKNKSTIHSHVDWKKAELTALKDKEE